MNLLRLARAVLMAATLAAPALVQAQAGPTPTPSVATAPTATPAATAAVPVTATPTPIPVTPPQVIVVTPNAAAPSTSNVTTTNSTAAGQASTGANANNAGANTSPGTATGTNPNGTAAAGANANGAPANGANGGAANGAPANGEANAAASNGLPARGTYRLGGSADNMSVFAVGVDAAELLTALASRMGLPLLVDDKVARRLTVSISGKPAREVVRDIASAYGLGTSEIEGVMMISEGIPRDPGSYVLSQIESVPTRYVDASNARNLLPVFLQDYVKVNSEQNSVVLSAPRDVLNKFRDDIARFDTPASQILVDLLVVELTDTTLDQLGFALGFGNAGEGLFYDSAGGLTFRAVASLPQSFNATIRALQEKGRARVRANPRIATVSGARASIFVGRQRYIVTPIDTGNGQRNFIDAGVRLGMTPFTGGQGQILVEVDTEVSTLSAVDPLTRLPEKSTRTANTTVRVADGQTIVIGGLKQQEQRIVNTRIPILGSLPILGPLFRSRDIRNTDSDLVIFITPRTLGEGGHLPEAEEKRLKEQFLDGPLNSPLPAQAPTAPNVAPGAEVPNRAVPNAAGAAPNAGAR